MNATSSTFALHVRRAVFSGTSEGDITHQNFDVAPDSRLLLVQPVRGEAQLVLVYGWGDELRQRLAAGKR